MRGELTSKILEVLAEAAGSAADVIEAILSEPYGASYSRLERAARLNRQARSQAALKRNLRRESAQRYYNVLYHLKKDGLVQETQKGSSKILSITQRGMKYLAALRKNKAMPPSTAYPKEQTEFFTIVAFDVPEKERRKRDWLRSILKNLGLKMIQKSVWLGKIKIPREFIEDLRRLNLLEHVEIFQITKAGSLRQIT